MVGLRYTELVVAPKQRFSPAEYLAWERAQTTKHEYFRGEVFAMAGGSPRHNALCARIITLLHDHATRHGCHVMSSDQRIGIDDGERYVYPDVTVVCGAPRVENDDVITNPKFIIEVLSRSTEQNDRGSKWQSYQHVASLTDYVLVPQWSPIIEHFQRDARGGWSYRSVGSGDRITLADGTELAVDDVFARVMELPGDAVPPLDPESAP